MLWHKTMTQVLSIFPLWREAMFAELLADISIKNYHLTWSRWQQFCSLCEKVICEIHILT